MACINCEQFGLFLKKRTEFIDKDILEDWFPTQDAWVGHVSTGLFPAGSSTQNSFWRYHMAFPDLTGGRQAVVNGHCEGSPCDPTEKKIGYGMDQIDYSLTRESYTTDLICWDQNQTIDEAKQKWALFVKNLRQTTAIINSNWFKMEAMRGAGTLYLAGSAGDTVPSTFTAGDTTIAMSGKAPTSILTLPFLNKFVEQLQLEGYFQQKFANMPMFKLITDLNTSQDLRTSNPALAQFQATEISTANNALYKLGITSTIGNFGISIDHLPPRFNFNAAGDLVRVFPYENAAANVGIKRSVSTQYLNATVQASAIWHPNVMKMLVMDSTSISPDMPFLVRDFAGKWRFAMDNIVIDGQACDNKRRNKGVWYADFQSATRYERPELVRWILHLTNRPIIEDVPAAQQAVAYSAQVTSSANAACTNPVIQFTPTLIGGFYNMAANTAVCNGVPVVHSAVTSNRTSIADLVTSLNSVLVALGTWAAHSNGTDITLSGSSCCAVQLTWA